MNWRRGTGWTLMVVALQGLSNAQTATPAPTIPRPAARPAGAVQLHALPPPSDPAVPTIPTLVFDADLKEYPVKPGETSAPFTFNLTNVWTNEIRIDDVHPSCGCTTVKLPPMPWHIPPGGHGTVDAEINLMGKGAGVVTKTLTFFTSVGSRVVSLRVIIPSPELGIAEMTPEARQDALLKAAADARAIFHGDCATCHVNKALGATGEDLYAADCGICHESPRRATSVPDLHALRHDTNYDYWRQIIAHGKPHTMMPGFAVADGGPLSEAQITSLASYLNRVISHDFSSRPAGKTVN